MTGPGRVLRRARLVGGALLFDLPVWARALRREPGSWREARNREDVIEPGEPGGGVRVSSQWSVSMHAPRVIPALGRALWRRALAEHPVELRDGPPDEGGAGTPEASVLICHRGLARLPHLLATLSSLAGQRGAPFECLVVEQAPEPEVAGHLPAWVRHVHQPWAPGVPFGRAHAFNFGAGRAASDLLVFHDNDMLVPADYVRRIVQSAREGFEFVNMKRFIFYLSEDETRRFFARRALPSAPALDSIIQNLLGGGSVAATRAAFAAIGGMDEGFVGWGGEDVEFWDRALTRKACSRGELPLVHLWHEPQPGRTVTSKDTPANRRLFERLAVPAAERITELNAEVARRGGAAC